MAQNSLDTFFTIHMWKLHTISQSVDHETTNNCVSELQGPTYLLGKKSLFINVREITKSNSEKLKFVFFFHFNFSGETETTWLTNFFFKIT